MQLVDFLDVTLWKVLLYRLGKHLMFSNGLSNISSFYVSKKSWSWSSPSVGIGCCLDMILREYSYVIFLVYSFNEGMTNVNFNLLTFALTGQIYNLVCKGWGWVMVLVVWVQVLTRIFKKFSKKFILGNNYSIYSKNCFSIVWKWIIFVTN